MGGRGGDAIALVEYVDGADFLGAVEAITSRPPPKGDSGVKADPVKIAEQQRLAHDQQQARDREANEFRNKEIRRAHEIWAGAVALSGSHAESYLRYRGLEAAPGAKLRSYQNLAYWHFVRGKWAVIHQGPAMVAAIQGNDYRFIGCHITYIDAPLSTRSGKAQIYDPTTGEILDAKKVRGSQRGGHIHLGGDVDHADCLNVGEGIETVYSVRQRLLAARRTIEKTVFWSCVNLDNMAGKCASSVAHPTKTITDAKGRVRAAKVKGPIPDLNDSPVLMPPSHFKTIYLLEDGDSDPFATRCTMLRAATRWQQPDRQIMAARSITGADFNDMHRGLA